MPKGVRLTLQQKREIATDYVGGKELSQIAQERELDLNNLYNMRKKDPVYQEIEETLQQAMDEKFRTRVRRQVHDVLDTMKTIADMSTDNEVVSETRSVVDEKGRRMQVTKRTYKIDAKLLYIKYQANERLLDAFLRLNEGEAAVQQSERLLEMRAQLLRAYGIEPTPLRVRPDMDDHAMLPAPPTDPVTIDLSAVQPERSLKEMLADFVAPNAG